MTENQVKVSVDILVLREDRILLGLLTKKWSHGGNQVYGVPGRDINFGDSIRTATERDIRNDLGCEIKNYEIICVNANHGLGNHYIGIGVAVEVRGEVKNLTPEDWEKWEWFKKDEIPKNLFPSAQNLIECYLSKKFSVSE